MRATDWCLSSAGAALVLATSSDEQHPAESVVDGSSETFWTTTGMFPQEFIVGFPKCVKISKVAIQSYLDNMKKNVRSKTERTVTRSEHGDESLTMSKGYTEDMKTCCLASLDREDGGCDLVLPLRTLRIERSLSEDPVGFEECIEKDLEHTEGQLQKEEFPLPEFQATYLRFIIKSAFDHFVSVHRVIAEGAAENT